MFGLIQRSLFISELRQNDEAAAHSLPRGDSVLTSAHILGGGIGGLTAFFFKPKVLYREIGYV